MKIICFTGQQNSNRLYTALNSIRVHRLGCKNQSKKMNDDFNDSLRFKLKITVQNSVHHDSDSHHAYKFNEYIIQTRRVVLNGEVLFYHFKTSETIIQL